MFVDNLITAIPLTTTHNSCANMNTSIEKLTASSIEAAYLIVGNPGPIQNPFLPPTLSRDKMVDRIIGHRGVALGHVFNTKNQTISIEDDKVQRLLHII